MNKRFKLMLAFIIAVTAIVIIFLVLFRYLDNSTNQVSSTPTVQTRIGVGLVSIDEDEIARYTKLVKYFSDHSENGWYLVPVKDYGSFISKMQTGQIQAGFAGSAAGYKLIMENEALPVFRPQRNGSANYSSYIISKTGSGISRLEDLSGKRFAYVDPFTSAGYLNVIYSLKNKGLDPDNFFKSMDFVGNHKTVIYAVLSGKYDGGALKNTVWDKEVANNSDLVNKITVIEKEGSFPDSTFIISKRIDYRKEINSIERTLGQINNTEEGKKILESFGAEKMVTTTPADFKDVQRIYF